MNSSLYLACDLEECRRKNHRFRTTWSDKSPLKVSLMCDTCSEATGRNAYVAYGDTTKPNFGQWRRRARIDEPQEAA